MKMIYRQGDVLLVQISRLPAGTMPIAREPKGIVLAHGEATGHAHIIEDTEADFMEQSTTRRRYLRLVKPTRLLHDEHAPIELPPGRYEVRRQREYMPDSIRTVAD